MNTSTWEPPTGHGLWEKHQGKTVRFCNLEGIVCGYSTESAHLICAITSRLRDTNAGWKFFQRETDDTIITCRDNKEGYFYVTEKWIK